MPRTVSKQATKPTKNAADTVATAPADPNQHALLYKKLSHLEHILVRPSTYLGSIDKTTDDVYVVVRNTPDDSAVSIQRRTIEYVPALYKIFDEILVNATDHYTRLKNETGETVARVANIKVDIEKDTGRITVYNDGDGIHIVETEEKDEKGKVIYAPELIFGHLLTGTNYDDSSERIVGGQNGYGAKLANIFSKEFTVETVDRTRSQKYIQTFRNNMRERSLPKITACSTKPYTRISFIPDYERFGLQAGLTDDILSYMEKRVYDISAWTDKTVSVCFNGKKLDYKSFEKYADLYIGDKNTHPRVYLELGERWEAIVSYNDNSLFEHVSFVNGIHTSRGGKHVEYIVGQIRDGMVEYLKKKRKVVVKPATVRNELFVFLKSTISNPSFDSQTKETLTTPVSKFGSTATVDDKMIDKIAKTGVMEHIMNVVENKNAKDLQKTDGKKQSVIRGLPKLYDAEMAGTKDSMKCVLILTEGDSAKSSVISGLGQENRKYYGVFPLRGKLLNVKDADVEKVSNNAEITAIKKIMGLKSGIDYSTPQSREDLRYGKIMILCDSDVDGSHIKGLLMNFFHTYWDTLLQSGFLITMLTPIVKVNKGAVVRSFYNLGDYKAWKDATADASSWTVKYYKGLGTSTATEFKEYFSDMRVLNYTWSGEGSSNAIDLAFNKKRADDRKKWLEGYDLYNTLDYANTTVAFEDFVNRDLIHFSNYDNIRSIPNICDGLKPSQRKILFSAFKRNLTKEIKVAQFAGYVSEHASYHHGEVSLQGAIVSMAQSFVGANNIALFVALGAFGTRMMGGSDSASARYIFTHLHPITQKIYRPEDAPILNYLDDDGFMIEPSYYVPILPMILVNGSKGIGTGYSCEIPPHHPMDIVRILKATLADDADSRSTVALKPWFHGFRGTVYAPTTNATSAPNTYPNHVSKGMYRVVDDTTIDITELPIGMWSEKYKQFLEDSIIDRTNPSKKQFIKSYREQCVDDIVYFQVKMDKEELANLEADPAELERVFKLVDNDSTTYTNMYLYDNDIHIHKYASPYDIIEEFYEVRLEHYHKRKAHQLRALKNDLDMLRERYRFISMITEGTLEIRGKSRVEVEEILASHSFLRLSHKVNKEDDKENYDYLVNMPIYSLTRERMDELKTKMEKKQVEYDTLVAKDVKDIWREELDEFEVAWCAYVKECEGRRTEVGGKDKKMVGKKPTGRKRG